LETADGVIIGGGIVGLTTAFHLAQAGAGKVVLCERGALGERNGKWILEGRTELDLAPWLAGRFRLMGG